MKVVFFLNEGRQKNLYCRVSDGKERFTISLGKTIESKDWDNEEGMPKSSSDIDIYFGLKEFKEYLEKKYYELKANSKLEDVLTVLKKEAAKLFSTTDDSTEEHWDNARAKLHDIKHQHPIKNYIDAFLKFSGANRKDIRHKPLDGHILIEYEDITYMISHTDDFIEEYKHYFEKESYDEIYTQTPHELWDYLLKETTSLGADELIVEVYRAWRVYWRAQRDEVVGGERRYEMMKNEAFQELQVLFQTINIDMSNAISNANSINDIGLIPVIAMALYNQYENKAEFYEECVSYITEYGEDYLTHGDTFEAVCIDENDESSDEWYYIYNPMFGFND
jgi:hypothetical protein